jgi:hypothetical protein
VEAPVLISYIGLGVGLAVSAVLVSFAVHLLRADRLESRKSAARAGSLSDAIMGRAKTRDDWMPDGRVKGGMIYNRKKKRIEISGRLSNDTLDRVFR